MIQEEVREVAEEFRGAWASILSPIPSLQLDYSWPSIGILDLLSYHLRTREQYTEVDVEIARGMAAYLAVIAYNCWSRFPNNPEIQVRFAETSDRQIVISASGAPCFEEGKSFSVPITSSIARILEDPPQPFPVFERFCRSVSPEDNLLSLFALGLFSGLTPYGSGGWEKLTVVQFQANLRSAEEFLATSSAAYYKSTHPYEYIGQSSMLYLNQLILPPAFYDEPAPACRATQMLCRYFKKQQIEKEEIRRVALNLAASPDELISSTGFAVASALMDEKLSLRLRALCESKRHFVPLLRPAVLIARQELDLPVDWLQLAKEGRTDEALSLFIIERHLALLPLVELPATLLISEDYYELADALCWQRAEEALEITKKLINSQPEVDELTLQAAFLLLALKRYDEAEESLLGYEKLGPSSDYFRARLWELQAILALARDELREALLYFERVFRRLPESPLHRTVICSNYAWTLLNLGRIEEAAEVAAKARDKSFLSLGLELNYYDILCQLNRNEEAEEVFELIAKYACNDRRVFQEILQRAARKLSTDKTPAEASEETATAEAPQEAGGKTENK